MSGHAGGWWYLVRMSERVPVNGLFSKLDNYDGSAPFEQGREAALQHLLYAVAEIMKQLFWSGDLNEMSFPSEIDVRRLI